MYLHSRLDLNKSKVELVKSTHLKSRKFAVINKTLDLGFGWISVTHQWYISFYLILTRLFVLIHLQRFCICLEKHMAGPRSRPKKKPVDKASTNSCPLASRKLPCLTNCHGLPSCVHPMNSPMPAWWK